MNEILVDLISDHFVDIGKMVEIISEQMSSCAYLTVLALTVYDSR
jgi:hypothetical protein